MILSRIQAERLMDNNHDITNGAFVIPDGVTAIDERAFMHRKGLTQITFPDSLTSIKHAAFRGCTGLTQITLPHGLTSIISSAFSGCAGLTQVTLPDGLTSIEDYVFAECTALNQVILPDGLTSIGGFVFYRCENLAQIAFPDGLTSIGRYVFFGCTSLNQVILPDTLTSIAQSAFDECTSLQTIIINTKSNEEVERIKMLLPEAHRIKVVKNPVYADVIALKQQSYKDLSSSPTKSDFQDELFFFNKKLPPYLLVIIAGFIGDKYQRTKKAINQLPFPISLSTLADYENRVAGLVRINFLQVAKNVELIPCINILKRYLDGIYRQKNIKEKGTPLFFSQNQSMQLDVTEKIEALSKAINWLKGDVDLLFSPAEISVLNQGIIGETLNQFSIKLPYIVSEITTPSDTDVATLTHRYS